MIEQVNEIQIPVFNFLRKQKMKRGNENCNSVVRSNGKTRNENSRSSFYFNAVGKQKLKSEFRFPMARVNEKRNCKFEFRFAMARVNEKRKCKFEFRFPRS